jgi:hypothetical protein
MLADEGYALRATRSVRSATNFGLTNLVTDLICRGNDDVDSQGNYDYHAYAQVLPGGADPLGSQGFASVRQNPSSS